MQRLAFVLLMVAVYLTASDSADAQSRPPRVGIVWIGARPVVAYIHDHFVQGMRELGWIDGQNVVIEARFANDQVERLPSIFGELVTGGVDVLVAPSPTLTRAAREATTGVPIVMANVSDPVQLGLVASVRRPGGNVTGVANAMLELAPKCAQLIREILPRASRLAALVNPSDPVAEAWMREVRTATAQLADPHQYVFPGVLFACGTANAVVFRRVAAFVDRILKGARPGDLPVDHVEKVDFHINVRTAKALGLIIPPPVLYRADRVIE